MIAQLSQKALPSECRVRDGGCLAEDQAYIFEEDEPVCPYKKIQSVNLKPEGEKLLLDYRLGLMYNITGSSILNIEGCPQIKLYSTSYDDVFISLDMASKELDPIRSRNIHESESLLPTILFFRFTNHKVIQSLIKKQNEGDCSSWLLVGNEKDYMHPTIKKKGLFTRQVGPIVHEYFCKTLEVPIMELEHCIAGVPVVLLM